MGDNIVHGIAHAYYAVVDDSGEYGEFRELGNAMSFDIDVQDGEKKYLANAIASLPTCTTQFFTVKWWSLNRFFKLFGHRPPYTVRRLRCGGKSHKK